MFACADPQARPSDSAERMVEHGTTAGGKWRLSSFDGTRGETCLALEDAQNRFELCNANVIGQRPGGRGYVDWAHANLYGTNATVFWGVVAKPVSQVCVVLKDGRVFQARLLRLSEPVNAFVLDLADRVGARTFVAKAGDGRTLEKTPDMKLPGPDC
jgi:hypothetical protein